MPSHPLPDHLPAYHRLAPSPFDPKHGLLILKQAKGAIELLQAILR